MKRSLEEEFDEDIKHPSPSCSILSTVKVENVKRSLEKEFDEDIKGDEELLMVSREMKSIDNNTEPIVKIDDEKLNVAEVTDAVAKVKVEKSDNIIFDEAQAMLINDNNNTEPIVKIDDESNNVHNVTKNNC